MSPGSETRLFIVVPVYNNWEDTLECLRALELQTTRDFQVLIADDGSPEPAPDEISRFAFADYFRRPNLGFAGNCNSAAARALASGATHLFFLNNDTFFGPKLIAALLQVIGRLPDAMLSPVIYWSHRPDTIWSSGGAFTILSPFMRMRRQYSQITRVDLITGCALIVPAAGWLQLNGFDESYPTYFEDFDFCLRAKQAGIAAYIVPGPGLEVWHKVSGSFRGTGGWKQQYFLLETAVIFIGRHYRGFRKSLCYALCCVHQTGVFVLNLPELPNPRLIWRAVMRGFAARSRKSVSG